MLKVEMIIENHVASPDTPEQFIRNTVLRESGLYDLVDIKVVQGDNLKLTPDGNRDRIIRLLDRIPGEERVKIFDEYCDCCGDKNPNCQCWNDE